MQRTHAFWSQLIMAFRIISGGQTGVDRAALDVALKHQIDCGGWCPAGRLDEFGRIPDVYPIKELPNAGFTERTKQNVIDSDGTVIFYNGELRGGTELTVQYCREKSWPYLIVNASTTPVVEAAKSIADFLLAKSVGTLNVAGPRQSEWPSGYDYAFAVLENLVHTHLPGKPF
jgi:hypothetical protein